MSDESKGSPRADSGYAIHELRRFEHAALKGCATHYLENRYSSVRVNSISSGLAAVVLTTVGFLNDGS